MTPQKTLHLALPSTLVDTLTRAASERGLTKSQLVAQLLADGLAEWTPRVGVWGGSHA